MPSFTRPLATIGDRGADYKIALGEYIRALRLKADMTQGELAEAVGMSVKQAISAIESGRNNVPPERYFDFAEALSVKPRDFILEMLRLSNPWAYIMLTSKTPGEDTRRLNEAFHARR